MIVNLDFVIALDSMMHVLGLDKHELHHMEEKKNPRHLSYWQIEVDCVCNKDLFI
jgi:hypothetical protein